MKSDFAVKPESFVQKWVTEVKISHKLSEIKESRANINDYGYQNMGPGPKIESVELKSVEKKWDLENALKLILKESEDLEIAKIKIKNTISQH